MMSGKVSVYISSPNIISSSSLELGARHEVVKTLSSVVLHKNQMDIYF